jgi:hypothetical protein
MHFYGQCLLLIFNLNKNNYMESLFCISPILVLAYQGLILRDLQLKENVITLICQKMTKFVVLAIAGRQQIYFVV